MSERRHFDASGVTYCFVPAKDADRGKCDFQRCRAEATWIVHTGTQTPHGHAGMARWLCGEHALRWVEREARYLRSPARARRLGYKVIVGVDVSNKLPAWMIEPKKRDRAC